MITGHSEQIAALVNPDSSRVSLLSGPSGIGKRIVADHVALTLAHGLDILTVDTLTVDEARTARKFLNTSPIGGHWRILVADADTATSEASQALLKVLEEPPPFARVLLVASRPVLPTIRSRCTLLRFNALTQSDVAEVLSRMGIGSSELDVLTTMASGSPGAALALRPLIAERGRVLQLLWAISTRNWPQLGHMLRGTGEEGRWTDSSVQALSWWLSEAMTGHWRLFSSEESYGLHRSIPYTRLQEAAHGLLTSGRPSLACASAAIALMAPR